MNPEENQNNTPAAGPAPAGAPVPPAPAATDLTAPVTPPATDATALENAVNPAVPETAPTPEVSTTAEATVPDLVASAPASPEAPATETPSLDQVAADLAAAPAETPVSPLVAPEPTAVTPEAPLVAPDAPAAPEIPTAAPELGLDGTPIEPTTSPEASAAPAAPEATPVPDLTSPVAPESLASEPSVPETPVAPETTAPEPETTTETTETSASFIGDAPVAAPKTTSEDEDEEPLQPAAPVPGSIGSALAYSETAPGNAVPVGKPKKKREPFKLDKTNTRLLIIIIASVVLIAVVVVILLFIFNGSSSSNAKTTKSTAPAVTQPVVSSLTCTLEGGNAEFSAYGNVETGKNTIVAMYSDDELTSLGNTMQLYYPDLDSAEAGITSARQAYSKKYSAAGFTSDPFDSSYDLSGPNLTVTHQADGSKINTTNAKVMDLLVSRGEVLSDIDTLTDSYEADGYTCVTK